MKKRTKTILLVIALVVALYFLIYVPMTKRDLTKAIYEKYPEQWGTDEKYALLKEKSIKCLKGILEDPNYSCK
jgi:hypothetical protein